jgi:hypothetical protein
MVNSVHGSWTSAGWGPRWTQNRGGGGGSPELLLLAGAGHDGSSCGGENEGELTGFRFDFWIYFSIENHGGLSPWLMDQRRVGSTVDTEQRRRWWLTRALAPGRYGP